MASRARAADAGLDAAAAAPGSALPRIPPFEGDDALFAAWLYAAENLVAELPPRTQTRAILAAITGKGQARMMLAVSPAMFGEPGPTCVRTSWRPSQRLSEPGIGTFASRSACAGAATCQPTFKRLRLRSRPP